MSGLLIKLEHLYFFFQELVNLFFKSLHYFVVKVHVLLLVALLAASLNCRLCWLNGFVLTFDGLVYSLGYSDRYAHYLAI